MIKERGSWRYRRGDGRKSEPLKALTIRQPDATFALLGIRPLILRAAAAPPWASRRRIVIHAGPRQPRDTDLRLIADEIAEGDQFDVIKQQAEHALDMLRRYWWGDLGIFPLDVGLGIAFLGRSRRTERRDPWPASLSVPNPCGWTWPLLDPKAFAAPIPARAQRGFWRWPGETELALRALQRELPTPVGRRRRALGVPPPSPTLFPADGD